MVFNQAFKIERMPVCKRKENGVITAVTVLQGLKAVIFRYDILSF